MNAERIIKFCSAQVAAIDDPRDRLATQVGLLQGEIRKLCDALGRFQQTPKDDPFIEVRAADAPITLTYEFDPGQRGQLYGPPERCWEEIAPSVYLNAALVNGEWIDPRDVFLPKIIEAWEQSVINMEMDQ